MNPATRVVIFTDLDGTLLDQHNYSFEAASPIIDFLNQAGIPWILNTSKTLAESADLARTLDNRHPLIIENGGGIAVPPTYPMPGDAARTVFDRVGDYRLIALGAERSFILSVLQSLKYSFRFEAFDAMTEQELVALTDLNSKRTRQARDRQFSEPLVWRDKPERLLDFAAALATHSLTLLRGGRFIHVLGQSDKGRAMQRVLAYWFDKANDTGQDTLVTIALGDADNDRAMLEAADRAIVIRSPTHTPPEIDHPSLRISTGTGPEGWAESLSRALKELGYTSVNTRQAL